MTSRCRGFWTHAEIAAKFMKSVVDTIRTDSIRPTEIKALLHCLAHRHLSLHTWKEFSASITTVTCGSKKIPLTSILFYIMEGFIPMITMFCKQLEVANRADTSSKQIRELLTAKPISVLKAVAEGVMVSDSPVTQLEQDYDTPSM